MFRVLDKVGALSKIRTLIKPWFLTTTKALNYPLRITISNGSDHNSRTFTLRTYIWIILASLPLIAAIMIGHAYFPSTQQTAFRDQLTQLQHKQNQLTGKLADTEALLSLSNGQVAGLKEEMMLLGSENSTMKKRLDMFEDVLAARKVSGIHFLRPMARWLDNNIITYQLILVKGENYPRWIKGHLSFSVTDPDGHVIMLSSNKGKNGHKVEMKTHAFMEGSLAWAQPWRPDRLTITLIDHLERKKGTIEIPIFSATSQSPDRHPVPNKKSTESSP
ncbi:MAG: hypothetical protein Q9M08_01940 [Mariprofundus sp.]|nr:hypothetical protein [Mariprofundus sp.]